MNDAPVRPRAAYVLYWAQMNRRADSNHALEFAAARANALKIPLLVYEGLTCSYPYASDRFHTFILEGVAETSRRLSKRGIGYLFHLRRRRGDWNESVGLADCFDVFAGPDLGPREAARRAHRCRRPRAPAA